MRALFFLAFALKAQDVWTPPEVKPLPQLKTGPYAALGDGSLLTVKGDFAFTTRDDGATWSAPAPIFPNGPGLKVSNERALLRTREGVLLLAFMNLADLKWGWDDAKNQPADNVRLDVWVVRSLDEGKTWRDPQLIQKGYCGAVRQMIQLRSGRVVVAAQNFVYDPGHSVTITYASDDQGLHWRASNVLDLGGRGHHDGAIEPTLVELRNGKLWMLLRTNWDRFWEAFSEDGGHYWRTIQPAAIGASSSPAYITRLASGRLAISWNQLYPEGKTEYQRRAGSYSEVPGSWNREELSIAFSENEGKTWTKPTVIARKPKAWLSYPWILERRPGELWITTMQGGLALQLKESDFLGHSARIVAFGDSLTAPRAGVITYSDLLAREMLGVEMINAGVPGNTSTMARGRFDRDVLNRNPDIVVIQLGTNDSAVDVWRDPPATAPRVSLTEYRDNLSYFVQTLKARHSRVVLMTPNRLAWTDKLRQLYGKPPYQPESEDGFNVLLNRYSDAMRDLARSENIPLIDAASAMPTSLLLDGMHPGSEGHRLLANLLLKVLPPLVGAGRKP